MMYTIFNHLKPDGPSTNKLKLDPLTKYCITFPYLSAILLKLCLKCVIHMKIIQGFSKRHLIY